MVGKKVHRKVISEVSNKDKSQLRQEELKLMKTIGKLVAVMKKEHDIFMELIATKLKTLSHG